MKKKRFYNNKKRNTKWTEPVKGRKIDFADKYIEAGTGSDKFDKKRPKKRKKRFTAQKAHKWIKTVIYIVSGFLILNFGYLITDLYMERNSMPEQSDTQETQSSISSLNFDIKSVEAMPLSLDGGIMLDAVIKDAQEKGYSAVTFDLKRDDGTVGYESKLATIGAYGAVSSASSDLGGSVEKLLESDLLPVARISCYRDSIAPVADLTAAVTDGSSLYRDSDGSAYLNPDSDVTYNYIKGIIEEANGMGITVFVLDNTTLPEEIGENYADGFEPLKKKLYADFGEEIKLLCAVDIDAVVQDGIGEEAQQTDDETTKAENENGYGDEYDEYGEDESGGYDEAEESTDVSAQNSGVEKLLSDGLDGTQQENCVYYIRTNMPQEAKDYLDGKGITNYIISPQEDF